MAHTLNLLNAERHIDLNQSHDGDAAALLIARPSNSLEPHQVVAPKCVLHICLQLNAGCGVDDKMHLALHRLQVLSAQAQVITVHIPLKQANLQSV